MDGVRDSVRCRYLTELGAAKADMIAPTGDDCAVISGVPISAAVELGGDVLSSKLCSGEGLGNVRGMNES